jgi:predicted transcriptional regulator
VSLDLKTLSPIAGEDPRAIRDILRRCDGHMSETWLRKTLGFNDEKAREVASVLLQSGYVEGAGLEEAGQTAYKVTGKGRDLMRASAATRIRRTTAKLALDEFMGRVHRVNKNSAYLYSIIKVVVFGGFLRRGERLGDVDVAVDLKPRIPLRGNCWEVFQQHALNSGRYFASFDDEIDWPRREVMLALKARKRSISIQPWFPFIQMEKSPDFRYKVLPTRQSERNLR